MRRLVLIRHGRTEGNDRRVYYGGTDLPLTEAGVRELEEKRDAGLYPGPYPLIVTSGMLRTEQTLRCLYGDLPHEIRPGFREVNFGEYELRSYDELKDRPDYQAWLSGDWYGNAPPGGESFRAAEQRILAEFDRLRRQPEDVTAVVHGGTILVIMPLLFPEEGKNPYEWQPAPGCGYEVDLEAMRWRGFGRD